MDILTLFLLMVDRVKKINSPKGAATAFRRLLDSKGIPRVPFGTGNRKIGSDGKPLAGFYRKIGDTCPSACPYLDNGCYGQHGKPYLQQRRAVNELEATIASFLACAIINHKFCGGWPTRLFITDDLYRNNTVDRDLVDALKEASEVIRNYYQVDVSGYGYSHGHDKAVLQELEDSGMVILDSDYLGAGGTFLWPHKELHVLRRILKDEGNDVRLVPCAAQANKKKHCSNCRLCLDAKELNLCIIFDPHGAGKGKIKLQHKVSLPVEVEALLPLNLSGSRVSIQTTV